LRRREPIGRARFHFDKAERFAFVSDNVDLRIDDNAAQISSDGQREVCRDETVSALFEICGGVSFAQFTEFECR
jgi:hypothetical protein